MWIIAGYVTVDEEKRDGFVEAHRDLITRAREAPGCLDVAITADPVDPRRIYNYERWASWEAIEAWRGYFAAFPRYVIYPRRIAASGDVVAVQGHTTGSHLDLPDEDEVQLSAIWLVTVVDGAVRRWRLVEDTAAHRRACGLD